MASIASMGLPGRLPTFGISGSKITPESLFKNDEERRAYQNILDERSGRNIAPDVKVKKVCVRIFDLSNPDHVAEYEKLWAELLEKTAKNEVIVEFHKDLVHRKDGTSYWMKYVEYVEFGDAADEKENDGSGKKCQ